MGVLPLVFTSGWASGINAYAVVLLMGLFGRFDGVAAVPPGLERGDVLLAAAVLTLCQAVADKIPYLDSLWDAVHTVIRPAAGTVVGELIARHDHASLGSLAAGALGGGTALLSHLAKSGLRLGVNASPEPFSNILVSLSEELAVAGVVCLALFHPLPAALAAAFLLASTVTAVVLAASRIRRYLRARHARRVRLAPGSTH